jgi:polyisoprenoid-binding protein YceI
MSEDQASRSVQTTGEARSPHYRMDPGRSRFTVQAFASGLLSFLGHSPTFAVRDFEGEIRWAPDASANAGLEVTVKASSLELTDIVRSADREEIEGRMRREVLEAAVYPEIRFQADEIATVAIEAKRYRLQITGPLSVHGVTNRETASAELHLYEDGIQLVGELPLQLSNYRIPSVTALGGAIQLRDQLQASFDIVAWKEPS